MASLHPNPMICRSGMPLHWRAVEDAGLWHAELGITGVLSGSLRWERVGAPKGNQSDAEGTAVEFARIRAGRL
jgi:hypothetical protein